MAEAGVEAEVEEGEEAEGEAEGEGEYILRSDRDKKTANKRSKR